MCTTCNTPQDALQTTRPPRDCKPGVVTPTAELINPSRQRREGGKAENKVSAHSVSLLSLLSRDSRVTFWTSDYCILIWLSSEQTLTKQSLRTFAQCWPTLPPTLPVQLFLRSLCFTPTWAQELGCVLIQLRWNWPRRPSQQTRQQSRSLEARSALSLKTGRKGGAHPVWNSTCTVSTFGGQLWNLRAQHRNPTECQNSFVTF